MPVEVFASVLWLGLAFAEPEPPRPSAPDAELLEFLGSFETKSGQWPELNEMLAKKSPVPPKPAAPPNPGEVK